MENIFIFITVLIGIVGVIILYFVFKSGAEERRDAKVSAQLTRILGASTASTERTEQEALDPELRESLLKMPGQRQAIASQSLPDPATLSFPAGGKGEKLDTHA